MPWEMIPAIILVSFVLPVWLVLHYVTRWKKYKSISAEDETLLTDLRRKAERLEARLTNMERILDNEVPDWRQRLDDPI